MKERTICGSCLMPAYWRCVDDDAVWNGRPEDGFPHTGSLVHVDPFDALDCANARGDLPMIHAIVPVCDAARCGRIADVIDAGHAWCSGHAHRSPALAALVTRFTDPILDVPDYPDTSDLRESW